MQIRTGISSKVFRLLRLLRNKAVHLSVDLNPRVSEELEIYYDAEVLNELTESFKFELALEYVKRKQGAF